MSIAFRTRLFGVAALIVGVVLAVVLGLGWSALQQQELERFEDRLCQEARRVAIQPHLGEDPGRLESELRARLHVGDADELLVRLEPGPGVPPVKAGSWTELPGEAGLTWRADSRQGGPPALPPDRTEGPPEFDRGPPPPADADAGPRPPPAGGRGSAGRPGRPPPPRGRCELAGFQVQGQDARAARYTTPRSRMTLAASTAPVQTELQGQLQRALQVVVPLALLLTAAGAALLAQLSLRPVNRLRLAMQGVTRQALDQRLASAGEDREFQDLIAAYNTMLERLAASFQQASRFSADAAHELKTPLTILQGRLEQALQQSAHRAIQADLGEMLEEVVRLAAITRKLLLLSQADAGHLALHRERVDLAELLDTLVADAQMLATGQTVSSRIGAGLAVQGDALLLRQLFNNLLSNALRHGLGGGQGGWIRVEAQATGGRVEVRFANASAPLGPAERARFFDRFHRGDSAHGRTHDGAVDGHGLGLSLSREIARAHGGELSLQAGAADEVRLLLSLPLA